MACKCRNDEAFAVSFQAAGGAVYRYCRYCEKGSWETKGTKLGTSEVLKVASTIQPARRGR